jgi:hypothetical protein
LLVLGIAKTLPPLLYVLTNVSGGYSMLPPLPTAPENNISAGKYVPFVKVIKILIKRLLPAHL